MSLARSSARSGELKLPLEMEVLIPDDDPVRLLSALEELELSNLYRSYGKIKSSQATPRQLFKIVVYAAMNHIYSCRDIESACRRDINFMYLFWKESLHRTMRPLRVFFPFIFPGVPKRPWLKSQRCSSEWV